MSVPPSSPRSSIRKDVTAAYVSAATRIGAWAIVSAIVYRLAGPAHFAILALIRGTIGILQYTAVGMAPALVRVLAELRSGPQASELHHSADERAIYSTAIIVAGMSMLAGLGLAAIYAVEIDRLHIPLVLARQAPWAVMLIGAGTLLRLFSDASAALIQVRGRIALDHYFQATCDSVWALLTLALYRRPGLLTASCTYAGAGLVLVALRAWGVARLNDSPWPPRIGLFRREIVGRLLSFGGLVLLAQLADYLYAPTDFILIKYFFGEKEVAAYAPAVQIDLGLLMLVSGLAAVLLPRTAIAHAAGSRSAVRRYYFLGTLASLLLLSLGAAGIWALYPLIFRLWFGPHPPQTYRILDLVLIGTVIGGSSAVGKSVLIGMGRIKPFTAAAIIAGIVNVVASYCFVRYGHFGLRGILYGTLVAVIGRCGLWMPWYVLSTLRAPAQ